MPARNITGSVDITTLDSTIEADLCQGKFFVDIMPSIFATDRSDDIEGVKVKIENPSGIVVKEFDDDYDILNPLVDIYNFPIPTQADNFQYGRYLITVQLTDSSLNTFELEKPVTISHPDPDKKTRKYGCLGADIKGVCNKKKVFVYIHEPPVYRGKVAQSSEQSFTFEFPTGGLDPIGFTEMVFSHRLYEGEYKVMGELCAKYNGGDNVYYLIPYKVKVKKRVLCQIDLCCVYTSLVALNERLDSDCTEKEKVYTNSVIMDALRLVRTAELANQCGEDASEYIDQLERLLGCKCACNCDEYNYSSEGGDSVENISIQGCNVTSSMSGLTKVYNIDNHEYVVSVLANDNIMYVVSTGTEACVKTTTLKFDIVVAYGKIKGLANADTTEANFWASVISKTWNTLDVSGLGTSVVSAWSGMSYTQRTQAIIDKIVSCCNCGAAINTHSVSNVNGTDAKIVWTQTGAYSVSVYLDGNFVDTVISPIAEYTLQGVANGANRAYRLVPSCESGAIGTAVSGSFNYLGCPTIAAPNLSSNSVNNATCPFDLTSLMTPLGTGLTAEWHTANTTSAATLVPTPSSVNGGVYYVFAKDANGCYSPSNSVQVICNTNVCTAPQGMNVVYSNGMGGYIVTFLSAAYPPPANSYTVKRRLTSDSDVPGSYTTIGSPDFDASTGRWRILDTEAAANNIEYTYVAMSNCGATQPAAYFTILFCEQVANFEVTNFEGQIRLFFSIRSYPPADGFRVRYRRIGTTDYTTVILTPELTYEQFVVYQIIDEDATLGWEGTLESLCGEGSSSEAIPWSLPAEELPHVSQQIFIDVYTHESGQRFVRAHLADDIPVVDDITVTGTVVNDDEAAIPPSTDYSITIPAGEVLVIDSDVVEPTGVGFFTVTVANADIASSEAEDGSAIIDLTTNF